MHPVRTLFSRRTLSRLAYWLSALGYNLRDRSFSNHLYGIYFLLFWSAWGIAVLTWLGDAISNTYLVLAPLPPLDHAAALLGQYVMAGWLLLALLNVTHHSPFILNEEDAYLLCQTPVLPQKVAVALFLQGFANAFLFTAAGALIASFALAEWHLQEVLLLPRLLSAIWFSLRAMGILLPLQMGIQALLWGWAPCGCKPHAHLVG